MTNIILPTLTGHGFSSNHILTGGAGNDGLLGGAAIDMLKGGKGADTLIGGLGVDTLDTLIGGLGADILVGGLGNDTFKYNSLAEIKGDKIINMGLGDKIDLSSITGLTFVGMGMDFDGTINQVRISDNYFPKKTLLQIDTDGDSHADYSLYVATDFTIEGPVAGLNIFQLALGLALSGTNMNDNLIGYNGGDRFNGLSGNDYLDGGYGADGLDGGYGADTLVGGYGADILTGGEGNDVFKYNSLTELHYTDTITDLMRGDKIDLSAIDANIQQTGDQAFSFLNSNAFTGDGSELYYSLGTLYGDVNGDKNPDFAIIISGLEPTASNFIL